MGETATLPEDGIANHLLGEGRNSGVLVDEHRFGVRALRSRRDIVVGDKLLLDEIASSIVVTRLLRYLKDRLKFQNQEFEFGISSKEKYNLKNLICLKKKFN